MYEPATFSEDLLVTKWDIMCFMVVKMFKNEIFGHEIFSTTIDKFVFWILNVPFTCILERKYEIALETLIVVAHFDQ